MPVYLIRAGVAGPVKIGTTSATAFQNRLIKMQVDNAEQLVVLRLFEGDRKLERELHKKFSVHRLRGEWFSFHSDMLGIVGVQWNPPPKPPYVYDAAIQQRVWTPERRAAAGIRTLGWGQNPERLAKYRATMAGKRSVSA